MLKSENVGSLAAALAKAQGAMGSAKKESSNPFFKSKYADLAAIVEAIKVPLSSNGLAYIQATDTSDAGDVIIETMLMHESGEWVASILSMRPTKSDPQGVGSCISYARRYGLQALLGVPADDDDGNASTGADRDVEVGKATPTQETAKDRFNPRTPRGDDGGASLHGRPETTGGSAPPANPIPNPDILPADPSQVVATFDARVITMPRPAWADDATAQAQKGVQLAQNLRTHGMKDAQRERSGSWRCSRGQRIRSKERWCSTRAQAFVWATFTPWGMRLKGGGHDISSLRPHRPIGAGAWLLRLPAERQNGALPRLLLTL